MPRASIHFEDIPEGGVTLELDFDEPLPDDPSEASEAQVSALVAFKYVWDVFTDENSVVFDDGESEEASLEV